MSTSTNGQLCYGILFDEGASFPWDDYGEGILWWWLYDVLKLEHTVKVFDKDGYYVGGRHPSTEVTNQYRDERNRAFSRNPLPVIPVNYCSNGFSAWILAIPRSVIQTVHGSPTKINPATLIATSEETRALIDFCTTYGLVAKSQPGWYLSSYWDC